MRPVVYHCEADVELVEAAKYYQCQRQGLGRKFLHAVHVAMARIQENPNQFPIFDEPVRSCRVLGFPHRLFFEVLPNGVFILPVAHASREPGYWKGRVN